MQAKGKRGRGEEGKRGLDYIVLVFSPLLLFSPSPLPFHSFLLLLLLTLFPNLSLAQAPAESNKLRIVEADRLELRTENKEELVILTGSPVKLLRGEEKIEADRILYNKSRKVLKLLGNVYYLDKDQQEIRAEELDLDTSDDSFEAIEVRLKSGEFDLIGPICQRAAGQILLEQGYFTSCLQCGHDVADYAFRAREVLLYPGDRIIAREVQILVRDTPVMYLPVLLLFLTERRPKLDVGFNSDGTDGAYVIADLPFVSDFGIGFSLLRYWEKRGWGFGLDLQGVGIAKQRTYFEFLPPTVADRNKKPSQTTGYLKYDFSYLLDSDEEWLIDAAIRRNDVGSNDVQGSVRLTDLDFKINYKLGEPIYKLTVDTFLDHDPTTPFPTNAQRKPELEVDFPQGYKDGGFTVTGRIVAGLYEAAKNFTNSAAVNANKGTTIQAGRLLLEHNEGFSYNSSTAGAAKVGLPQGSLLKPLPKFTDAPRYTPTANDKIVLNGFLDEANLVKLDDPPDRDTQTPNAPKPPQITLTLLNGTITLPVGAPLAVEAERLEVDFGQGGDFKIGELTFLPGSPFVPPPGSADTLPEGSITVPPGSTLNLPEGSKVSLSYTLATLPLRQGSQIEIPAGSVFVSLTNPTPITLGAPVKYTVPGGSLIQPGQAVQPQPGQQPQPTQGAQPQPGQAAQPQPDQSAQSERRDSTQPPTGQGAQAQPGQAAQAQPGQATPPQPGQAPPKQITVTFEYTPEPGSTLALPEGANLTIPPIPPRPAWEGFTLNINNRFAGYYYTFQAQRQIAWSTIVTANQVLGPFTVGLNFNRNITEGQNPFGNLDTLGYRRSLFLDYNLALKPDPILTATAIGGYEYIYGRTANASGWRSKPLQFSIILQPDPILSINAGLTRNIELDGSKLPFEPLRFGIAFTPSPLNLNFNLERDIQNRVPIKSDLNLTLSPVPFSLSFRTSFIWNKLNSVTNSIPTYDPINRYEQTTIALGYNPQGSTISLNHLRDLNNGQAISTQLQINVRDEQNTFSINQNLSQPYFGELTNKSNRFRLSGNAFANLGPHNLNFRNEINFPEPTVGFAINPENGTADFDLSYGFNQPGNTTTVSLNWKTNFVENCFVPGQRPRLGISSRLAGVDAIVDFSLSYRFAGCELVRKQDATFEKLDQRDYLERVSFLGGFTILPSPLSLEDGLGLAIQGNLIIERRPNDGRFEFKMVDFGPTFSLLGPENTRFYFSTFFNAPYTETVNNVSVTRNLILPAFFNENFILKPKFILAIDRCCWSTRFTWDLIKGEFKWTVLLGDQAADFLWNRDGFQFPGTTTQP